VSKSHRVILSDLVVFRVLLVWKCNDKSTLNMMNDDDTNDDNGVVEVGGTPVAVVVVPDNPEVRTSPPRSHTMPVIQNNYFCELEDLEEEPLQRPPQPPAAASKIPRPGTGSSSKYLRPESPEDTMKGVVSAWSKFCLLSMHRRSSSGLPKNAQTTNTIALCHKNFF
jgi:hypothetical protein